MKPRKGYIKLSNNLKVDCLIHGFFQYTDGDLAEAMAIIEREDGRVQTTSAEDVVFTEKIED